MFDFKAKKYLLKYEYESTDRKTTENKSGFDYTNTEE